MLLLRLNLLIVNYVRCLVDCYSCYVQKYYTIKTCKYYLQFEISIIITLHTLDKLYTHTQVNKYTITDLHIYTHKQKNIRYEYRYNYKYTFTPIFSLYVFRSKIMNIKFLTNAFKNKCKHHFTCVHVTYIDIIYTYCYQYTHIQYNFLNIQYNIFSTCYLPRFLKTKLLFRLIKNVCLRANLNNDFYKIYIREKFLNKIDLLFIIAKCGDCSNDIESLCFINQYG